MVYKVDQEVIDMKVTKDTVNKDMVKPMGKVDVEDEGIDLMDFIVGWYWPYPKLVYGELNSSTYDEVDADECDDSSKGSDYDLVDLIERNRKIAGY